MLKFFLKNIFFRRLFYMYNNKAGVNTVNGGLYDKDYLFGVFAIIIIVCNRTFLRLQWLYFQIFLKAPRDTQS